MGRIMAIDTDIEYWKQALAALGEGNVDVFFEKMESLRKRAFSEKREENDYITSRFKRLPAPVYVKAERKLDKVAEEFITPFYEGVRDSELVVLYREMQKKRNPSVEAASVSKKEMLMLLQAVPEFRTRLYKIIPERLMRAVAESRDLPLPNLEEMIRVVNMDSSLSDKLDEPIPGDRDTFVAFFNRLHKRLINSHKFSPLNLDVLDDSTEVDENTLKTIRAYLVHYDLVSVVAEGEQRDLNFSDPQFSQLVESVARYKNISLFLNNFLPALGSAEQEAGRIKLLRRILRKDHLKTMHPGLTDETEQKLILDALDSEWNLTLAEEDSENFLEELLNGIRTQPRVDAVTRHGDEITSLITRLSGHEQFYASSEVVALRTKEFKSKSRARLRCPDPLLEFKEGLAGAPVVDSNALVVLEDIKWRYDAFHQCNQVSSDCYLDPKNVYIGFKLNQAQIVAILNNASSILLTDKQVDELLNGVSSKLPHFDRSRYANIQGFFKQSRRIKMTDLLRSKVIKHCTGFPSEKLREVSMDRQRELFRIYSDIKQAEIAEQVSYERKVQEHSRKVDLVNLEDLKQLSLIALKKLLIELQAKQSKSWSPAGLERKINLIKVALEAIRVNAVCANRQELMSYLIRLQGKYSVLAENRHFFSRLFRAETFSQKRVGALIEDLQASGQRCLEAHAKRYEDEEPESVADVSRFGLR